MRHKIFAVTAALALSIAGFASGQTGDSLSMSSAAIYDACIANQQGPPTECACMAGFFGGRLQEDEFRLLAVINRFVDATGGVRDMPGAQAALQSEKMAMGMSDERFGQVMQRFTTANVDGAYGDRICVPLRGK